MFENEPSEQLVQASNLGSIDAMRAAIDAGGDVNYSNGCPLRRAILRRHESAISMLIDAGADVNANSIELAVREDAPPVVKQLLDTDPVLVERQWRSILFKAAGVGNPLVIRLLVDAWKRDGVVDLPAELGNAILGIPSGSGQIEALDELVRLGADIRPTEGEILDKIGASNFVHLLRPVQDLGVSLAAADSACFKAALCAGSTAVAIELGQLGYIGAREIAFLKGLLAYRKRSPSSSEEIVETALAVIERGFCDPGDVRDHVAKFNKNGELSGILARLEALALLSVPARGQMASSPNI